ncbi:MAG TPA: cation transporter [Gemmatimonadaceae bacterium]|nr:cation transporter [Gemmatimonadaceae bacterium]
MAIAIIRVTIDGMTSVHATRAVWTALTAVQGIATAEVSLGTAEIEHDGRATCADVRAAVAAAGYRVTSCREERRLPVV